jgi:hypothetical protein
MRLMPKDMLVEMLARAIEVVPTSSWSLNIDSMNYEIAENN